MADGGLKGCLLGYTTRVTPSQGTFLIHLAEACFVGIPDGIAKSAYEERGGGLWGIQPRVTNQEASQKKWESEEQFLTS